MNHDFICYIIISTIKIPHRLKNNFRYNYTVILYNNIIFRFSFQIRCSDEHTPRSGSEKIHFFFLFVANSTLISALSVIYFFVCFANAKGTHSKRSKRPVVRVAHFLSRDIRREKKKKEGSPFRMCPVSIPIFSPFFSFLLKYFRVASTLARHFYRHDIIYLFSAFFPFYFSEIYRNIGLERSNVVFIFFLFLSVSCNASVRPSNLTTLS